MHSGIYAKNVVQFNESGNLFKEEREEGLTP
jgi:hypothetical protein